MDNLLYLASFLVTILILVTVHEFGHYWVARRCGVRVLRFSIGFGKPIYKHVDKHGTEWAISPIPLGGYVKMYGEAKVAGDTEAQQHAAVPKDRQHESFAHQSVGRRMAIVFAGPAINILLAIVVYWLQAMMGLPDQVNRVAYIVEGSVAEQAGLQVGDTVLSAGGMPVTGWRDVRTVMAEAAVEQRDVMFQIERAGNVQSVELGLSCLPAYAEPKDMMYTIGLMGGVPLQEVPLIIEDVAREPALSAGLRAGDTIVAVNEQTVTTRADWDAQAKNGANQAIVLTWQRDGVRLSKPVILAANDLDPNRGFLGVQFEQPEYVVNYDPLAAVPQAFSMTADTLVRIVSGIVKMITGEVSIKHVGGPIQIAEVAGDSAKSGLGYYLGLLAALSIMLGIMNLLPVPVLDGGHLLYYAIEWVRGKPLSERAQAIGLRIGLAMIAALMILAFTNDFMRVGERIAADADQPPTNLCVQG